MSTHPSPEKHTLRWTPEGITWEIRKSGERGVHVHRIKYQEVSISTTDEPTEYAIEPFGGFFPVALPVAPVRFYWQARGGERCDISHLVYSITGDYVWTFRRGTPVFAMFARGAEGALTTKRPDADPIERKVRVIGYDLADESGLVSVAFEPISTATPG